MSVEPKPTESPTGGPIAPVSDAAARTSSRDGPGGTLCVQTRNTRRHGRGDLEATAPDGVVARPRAAQAKCGLLARLASQREKTVRRKGVDLNIMVAGESGVGKSTFVSMLFDGQLDEVAGGIGGSNAAPRTDVDIRRAVLVENGFEGRITVIETAGFGDRTDNTNAWVPLVNYVENQCISYMYHEEQPVRKGLVDTRVHVCVYFLPPTGLLSALDVRTMFELSQRVNLVPVLAKADSFTKEGLDEFRRTVREGIKLNNINIFEPGPYDAAPYAIISSTAKVLNNDGKFVYGRSYRWGIVDAEDPATSDLAKLRDVLMRVHLADLIDKTHNVYYLKLRQSLIMLRYRLAQGSQKSRDDLAESSILSGSHGSTTEQPLPVSTPLGTSTGPSLGTPSGISIGTVNAAGSTGASCTSAAPVNGTIALEQYVPEHYESSLALLAGIQESNFDMITQFRAKSDFLHGRDYQDLMERFQMLKLHQDTRFREWAADITRQKQRIVQDVNRQKDLNKQLEDQIEELQRFHKHSDLRKRLVNFSRHPV